MTPLAILELRSVVGPGGGPEKTILLGTAQADTREFAITVCYIRDVRDAHFDLAARASAMGVDYVEAVERHSFDRTVWRQLRHICTARNIRIVHAHEYKTDLLAYLLARRLGISPLATVHGWTGHTTRERRVYYPLDKRILARYPRLIAVSGEIKSELVRTGSQAGRISVVLNGIEPDRFRRVDADREPARQALGLAPDDVVIGSVGRLEPQKRFDILIDVVARLRARRPRVRLLIAGDGSLRSALDRQIEGAGLASVCRLLGHQPDVVGFHHAIDLYVQTSDYEGTPNVLLEAMAMRTPIVATSAGGTAEMVRDGVDGVVTPIGSHDAIVAAVDHVLDNPHGAVARARAARQRVETDLSFSARMGRVEQVYRELAS